MKKLLLIFDNDGVLVDSEAVLAHATQTLYGRYGLQVTPEIIDDMRGRSVKDNRARIQEQYGLTLPAPDDFLAEWEALAGAEYEQRLQAVPGAVAFFEQLTAPYCLATSGTPSLVTLKHRVTGLNKFFPAEKITTAADVAHSKPAPDLFLLAAKRMGYAPQDCWVIEDAINGVKAAKAAGMFAIGFTAASHMQEPAEAQKLRDAGADAIVPSFDALHTLLTKQQAA